MDLADNKIDAVHTKTMSLPAETGFRSCLSKHRVSNDLRAVVNKLRGRTWSPDRSKYVIYSLLLLSHGIGLKQNRLEAY